MKIVIRGFETKINYYFNENKGISAKAHNTDRIVGFHAAFFVFIQHTKCAFGTGAE